METTFQQGVRLLKENRYQESMEALIESYDRGDERQSILNIICDCFLQPNYQQLKANYQENSRGITEIAYDDLPLVFIPVSDELFFIFDLVQGKFLGKIDLTRDQNQEKIKKFHSVLVADCWDYREIAAMIGKEEPVQIYVVPSDVGRYAAFLQLPEFREKFLSNYTMFSTLDHMEAYFREHREVYLPKKIISADYDFYHTTLQSIHNERIATPSKREHIFLSICIPSYGREMEALRAVNQLRTLFYDSEIEIIVSNNAMVGDQKGYETIAQMKDSRIVYHAFKDYVTYGTNLMKVLELAKGKYAVIQSDQDIMLTENLESYLDDLIKEPSIGTGISRGIGENFPKEQLKGVQNNDLSNIVNALNRTYLTGIWYKLSQLHRLNAWDLFKKTENTNTLSFMYPHILLMLLELKEGAFSIGSTDLWVNASDSLEENMYKFQEENSKVQVRTKQCEDSMDMVDAIFNLNNLEFSALLESRIENVYYLMKTTFSKYQEFLSKKGVEWREVCEQVYHWSLGMIENYRKKIPADFVADINENLRNYYEQYRDGN
ncbi:MAG: glycosyltransferase [Lachnospiraceae bacterium]